MLLQCLQSWKIEGGSNLVYGKQQNVTFEFWAWCLDIPIGLKTVLHNSICMLGVMKWLYSLIETLCIQQATWSDRHLDHP